MYYVYKYTPTLSFRKKRKISLEKIFLPYLDIIALAYYRGSARGFYSLSLFLWVSMSSLTYERRSFVNLTCYFTCTHSIKSWLSTNRYISSSKKDMWVPKLFHVFGRVCEQLEKQPTHTKKPILLRPRNGPRGRPQ